MKIKSNYKDYYDHVAHTYGGGDPKFVYARVPIAADRCSVHITDDQARDLNMFRLWRRELLDQHTYGSKYIVIAGKRYLVVRKWRTNEIMPLEYRLFTEKNFPQEYEHNRKLRYSWRRVDDYSSEIGGEYPILTQIALSFNAPVYSIDQIRRGSRGVEVVVDQNIPVLANYDIPTIISAEQLYQDLSYYVANTMHPSPDLIVNDNQSDKEKILGHGFDVKQSFRHRK